MSTVTKSPFTRPTSVMSLLADQLESSFIDHSKSQAIEFSSLSKQQSNISSSAPTHRHSIPFVGFSSLVPESNHSMIQESDVCSPQLPSKRLCHSSTNDCIARPIPIKVNSVQEASDHGYGNSSSKQSRVLLPRVNMTIKTIQRHPGNFSIRPIISPHYKKSAFTPTRSLTSPQTTSSDYSISPDMESPIYRPASVSSSGFNDCSQQSLLIDPNYSPDSNQTSTCATIVNSKPHDATSCIFPRCHSQPCDEHGLRHFTHRFVVVDNDRNGPCQESSANFPFQVHTPMKRRYPSLRHTRSTSQSEATTTTCIDSPIHYHNSADTSPNATSSSASVFAVPKRDSYFFGSGRNYLISLPRIASSPPPPPPPVPTQIGCQNIDSSHRQRMGSNSSSVSTSTTTDTNTPTVVSNGSLRRESTTESMNLTKDNVEDVEMEDSVHENSWSATCQTDPRDPHIDTEYRDNDLSPTYPARTSGSVSDTSDITTKSYSTNSDSRSHCTFSIQSESSRSEFRDPDDPPEMIGFCFSQLNGDGGESMAPEAYEENSSFQELDIDQIELD